MQLRTEVGPKATGYDDLIAVSYVPPLYAFFSQKVTKKIGQVVFGVFQQGMNEKERMLGVFFMIKWRIVRREKWPFFLLKSLAF